uniref:preprotein translocase subunit SecY n=1 Tax=Lachnoclostridium phocaeense TaxID=1871021 RepID=UPI0026DAFE1D|nr:preprotein translocase subunit SecY [Lachnoclostridium phocaeense]
MRKFKSIWKTTSTKARVVRTIACLLILRLLCAIPTPGVNGDFFSYILETNGSLMFLDALTGGGLSTLSVVALSITPYITASIVIQLLAVIFPKIKEMQKGMEADKKKIGRITILTGTALALFQGLAMSAAFGQMGMLIEYKWYWILCVAGIWTIGSTLLSIAGKFMTDKSRYFIGNGVSLILVTNILSSYPIDIMKIVSRIRMEDKTWVIILASIFGIVAVILVFLFTTFMQDCEKDLTVIYSGKIEANGSQAHHSQIPIKLCPGGVVPIIFASTILTIPALAAEALTHWEWLQVFVSSSWFDRQHPFYSLGVILYILLIFGFSYYYTDMVFNADEVAANIKKAGGNIAGIRAGAPTAAYIRRQIRFMIAFGATALSILAVVPLVVSGVAGLSNLAFLGTSVVITVGVLLDTRKAVKVQSIPNTYKKKGGLFHA